MEEKPEQDSNGIIPKEPTLCEECKSNPPKYKCPGCSIRSCGLSCVKAHKQRTGCTGKRNQTQFVPISQFDDNLLLSDYNLLEEVKRIAESSQRMRTKLCGYAHFKLPYHLKAFRNAAGSRRTKILFLPSGMSKREKNQSRYDQRKKFISWTIEWRFHSTNIVLHDHGVNENSSFSSIIQKHLKSGPWNHPLRLFCDEQLDCLKLFIRKYPKGPKSPFKELDMKAPIRQQLANIVILEFPIIHVFLPSHSINFEVIKDFNPIIHKSLQKDHQRNQSPKGLSFREEEIDDKYSDPQVLDLMKHVDSSSSHEMLSQASKSPSGRSLFEGETVGVLASPKIRELECSKYMPFEFDQDFMDACANLMAEIDSDNFLDFESGFAKEIEEEARDLLPEGELLPVPEELEEGEILE